MRAPLPLPLCVLAVLLLGPVSAGMGPADAADAGAGTMGAAIAPAGPRPLLPFHSEELGPGLDVDMVYVDPAVRGLVGILEVSVRARIEDAFGVQVELDLPPEVIAVGLDVAELGDVPANETVVARFAVIVQAEGVHALRARASGAPSMEGFQLGWLKAEGVAPAILMVDVRSDEPAFGVAVEVAGAPSGGDATDETPEEPGPSGRPWPVDAGDDAAPKLAREPLAAAAAPEAASAATFNAKLCWNFALPQADGTKLWQRQRWYDYEVRAEVPGPDKVLTSGMAGKDGCVTAFGLPRTVDGAATRAYFAVRSCNGAVCVTGVSAPDGYGWRTPTKVLGTESTLNWGDMGAGSREYAGRMFARLNNAWTWHVNVALTPSSMVGSVDLRAPAQDYGECTCFDYKDIYIEVDGYRDVNEETVIHEFAHFFHYSLAPEWPTDAGGTHYLCGANQRPGLAWTEGYAQFASVRANFDLGAKGVAGASGDTKIKDEEVETNDCGAGENEFLVAASLWDLTDTVNDGKDDGWWNVPDVVFLIRACGGTSFRDFYDGTCGWRTAGRNMCVFLRSAYQNDYDFNRDPRATIVGPTTDTWTRGTRSLQASAEDLDVGTGNCPLHVEFWATTSSSTCSGAAGTLIATDSQAPYDVNFNTKLLTDGVAYYVCAIADDGMGWGKDRSDARFLIDNTPPVVAVDDDAGSDGWWNFPALVTAGCSDAHSGMSTGIVWPIRETRLDNDSWSEDRSSFWVTEDGYHWGEFRCYDRVGNVGHAGVHIRVDQQEPETLVQASPGAFDRDRVTVSLSCTDDAPGSGCTRIRYWLNTGSAQDYTGPFNITSGVVRLNTYSIDVAGNAGPTLVRSLGIDRAAPTAWVNVSAWTEATSLPGWHWSEPEITMECSDALAGRDRIDVRINGQGAGEYQRAFLLPVQGEVNVTATCHDKAGNMVNTSRIVRVDSRAPTAEYTLDGALGRQGWHRSSVSLDVLCEDDGSGIRRVDHRLSNGSWIELPVSDPVGTLDFHGTRWLEVRCSDHVGFNGHATPTLVRIDKLPPTSFASVSPSGIANETVYVTLTCADSPSGSGCAGLRYRIDGGNWTDYIGMFRVQSEGSHVVEHYAIDIAGNDGPVSSRAVLVDLTAPTLTRTLDGARGEGPWYVSAVVLTLTCADAGSGVAAAEYRVLPGGPWQSALDPVTLAYAANRWIEVRCVDHAGNVRAETIPVPIDPFSPGLTVTSTAFGWTSASNVTLTAICDDGSSGSGCRDVRVRRGGGEWLQYVGPIVHTEEGEATYELEARDWAGNVGASVFRTVRIDRTAPVATLTPFPSVPASGIHQDNVTVALTCSDATSGIAAMTTRTNGAAEVPYVEQLTLTENGTWSIVGGCRDRAGNAGHANATIRIDRTPAVLLFSLGKAGTTLFASWNATDVVHGITSILIEEQDLSTGEWAYTGCGAPAGGTSSSGTCLFTAYPGSMRCFRATLMDGAGNVLSSDAWCETGAYD